MALVLADRVQETTTTSGTGPVTLGGAVPGFQSFAVIGDGNTCYYTIVDTNAWEVGIGTYSTTGPSLARTTVLSNSNGNTSPITLSGSSASVFVTYPAEKSVNLDASGNASPLGTVASGTWQGSTVGVAYGGTGVTTSSGANSVVLRDANQNISVNRLNQANTSTAAGGGAIQLTAASTYSQTLTGSGDRTYKLPDATTLTTGVAFVFNNNATGFLTVNNYANSFVGIIPAGGAVEFLLLSNGTAGGTWDVHGFIPEDVNWGTSGLVLNSTPISGGIWQGAAIAVNYGGTGLTSYTSGGAVYANSSSTLTSGTLPTSAGGTGNTSGQAVSVANAVTFNNSGTGQVSGTTFNGSSAQTISYNTLGAQPTLVSGTNIKTINCASILGSGNISVGASAATPTAAGVVYGKTGVCGSRTALGYNAGLSSQSVGAVAIGACAGKTSQGNEAIAIGILAGCTGQSAYAIAIGSTAGRYCQQACSVAVGSLSGNYSQSTRAVAVGAAAGRCCQGANAIAIGYNAGNCNQPACSIAIGKCVNATGVGQTHIASIRSTAPTCSVRGLFYNPSTKEFTQSNALMGGDASQNIGYLNIPQNSQSTNYTLTLDDSGKHIYHPGSDANARTFTIPANGSVAYPIGTALSFANMSSQVVTIAITSDTMYLAGTGSTGSRSLAQYGTATALKIASTTWIISGVGLT